MVLVLVFEVEVIRVVSVYAPQCGRNLEEKNQFYCDIAKGCGSPNKEEFLIFKVISMGMLVSRLMVLMDFMEVLVFGREMWKVVCS